MRVSIIDTDTNEEVHTENGNSAHLFTLPSVGDFLSFAQQAWKVNGVIHISEGVPRLLVSRLNRAGGFSPQEENIAKLSRK
jgi:hypothetical protein